MKVAYLTNQYPHVRHTFIRREIVALAAHGIEVERFSIRDSGHDVVDPADIAERERTRAILSVGVFGLLMSLMGAFFRNPLRWGRAFLTATKFGRRSDRGVLRHWVYLAEACVLRKWLTKCGAEHLHVHFATNPAVVAMLCHQLGGPKYSITIHGPEEWDRPESLSLREKYEGASFVVAVSHFGRCQVLRWCGHSHWDKVHVVRCGVDAGFLREVPTPVPDVRRFVLVGALVEQKGHLILLRALKLLRDGGEMVEVVCAGDGQLRSVIESEAKRLGVADMIRITGWISNSAVRDELRQSRALVMSSLAENLPVAMMEAMAMGRPVIGTQIAGIPELIVPGQTGWVVAAGSPEAIADAMRECLRKSIDELTAMGERGAKRVAELHDADREAAKMAELFRNSA